MIFPLKGLEISFKDSNKDKTIFERVIQVNLVDLYYIKLCKIIKMNSSVEYINTYNLLDLVTNTKNCIH